MSGPTAANGTKFLELFLYFRGFTALLPFSKWDDKVGNSKFYIDSVDEDKIIFGTN